MARLTYIVVSLAIVVVLLAYAVRQQAHFAFTVSVTIPDANVEDVRQFLSHPESIGLFH